MLSILYVSNNEFHNVDSLHLQLSGSHNDNVVSFI